MQDSIKAVFEKRSSLQQEPKDITIINNQTYLKTHTVTAKVTPNAAASVV
jgi:hypothetical protein